MFLFRCINHNRDLTLIPFRSRSSSWYPKSISYDVYDKSCKGRHTSKIHETRVRRECAKGNIPLFNSVSCVIFIFSTESLGVWYAHRTLNCTQSQGKVYAINPAMIIILVPIITAATSSVDPLVMIHWGTYVSALSVFFLAFSTSLWACVMFVVTLSLGESLWSPRLYDYTTSVAQEGREGTYMALSSAPLFLAKLPVGFISGKLLQSYCPEHLEEGEVRHSKTMWQIIALSTIVSPISITLLWGYISGGGSSRGNDGERSIIDGSDKSTIEGENCTEDDSMGESSSLSSNISLPRVRQSERPLMR